ncbi:MAG: hypothetical protein U5K74_06970 [Gemmatimonadaceae bacterium]|nr:hypothetical protein [Gemmatimonadaceae bacterium]
MRPLVRRLVVIAGAVHLLGTCLLAQTVAQQGAVVRHPAGYAVTLPAGWSTTPLDAEHVRILPPSARDGEALVFVVAPAGGVTSVTDPESIRQSEAQIRLQYPQLRRVGEVRTFTTGIGRGIRLDFEGQKDGVTSQLSIYAAIRRDQTVSIIAAGPKELIMRRLGPLDAVFATLNDASPAAPRPALGRNDGSAMAREWTARLDGRTLTVMSGYSSGASSGGMTSRSDLVLRRDGRFTYTSSSAVSISVEGMGGSSSGRDAAEGTWRIFTRGGATVVLALTSADGRQQEFVLTRRGTQTFLNGTRAFVTEP